MSVLGEEMRSVGLLLSLLVASLACSAIDHKAQRPEIIGGWISERYEGQLGAAVQRLCFRADGSVLMVDDTQAGQLRGNGAYRLERGNVAFRWSTGSEAVAQASIRLNTLTLTSDNGKILRFTRQDSVCE